MTNKDMKNKTIKVGWLTREFLQFVKEHGDNKLTFDEIIMRSIRWRNAVIIIENDKTSMFRVNFIEFREDMLDLEVGEFEVAKYDDEECVKRMIDPDRVVIQAEKMRVRFSYPLSHVVEETHERAGGFRRVDVLRIVGEGYARIYKEEAETMTNVTKSPLRDNRGVSNGKHGIYGHVIDDLVLETLSYNKREGVLELGIGS